MRGGALRPRVEACAYWRCDLRRSGDLRGLICVDVCVAIRADDQPELAGLAAPSAASVLRNVLGTGGQMLVMASLLVTLLNSWLAWTILVSELPYEAAQGGVFPKFLARTNRFG